MRNRPRGSRSGLHSRPDCKSRVSLVMRYLVASVALAVAALLAAVTIVSAQPRPEAKRPPRIVIHPRAWTVEPPPSAKRYCRSWLVQQNRPSGPVIVPVMQCWWQ
jgi:hypothetical protein